MSPFDQENGRAGMLSLEFQVAVAPTAAFFSQLGMLALSLRALGPPYSEAPIHVSIGHAASERVRIPECFGLDECRRQLHWHWVSPEEIATKSFFALGWNRFRALGASEVVCMCDVDTLFVRRIDELLEAVRAAPAITGVGVHGPQFTPRAGQAQFEIWQDTARRILGEEIDLPCRYTLFHPPNPDDNQIPFCPNFGVVIAPRNLLGQIAAVWENLREAVLAASPCLPGEPPPAEHFFCGQIALALAISQLRLPWRELPMRYNWPNDDAADLRYPEEISEVRVLHYLRRTQLARERVFCERQQFDLFMSSTFQNAGNRILQERVRRLTHGKFLGLSSGAAEG
jgi:hypothetical protein